MIEWCRFTVSRPPLIGEPVSGGFEYARREPVTPRGAITSTEDEK